jgi:hypothetical protein
MWQWGQCSGPTSKLLRHNGHVMVGTLQGNRCGVIEAYTVVVRRNSGRDAFQSIVMVQTAAWSAGSDTTAPRPPRVSGGRRVICQTPSARFSAVRPPALLNLADDDN